MSRSVTIDLDGLITRSQQGAFAPPVGTPVSVTVPIFEVTADGLRPAVVVQETYPANPDVVLSPGQTVNTQLQTSGRIVELLPGNYGDQQISPASSVILFCRSGRLATQLGEGGTYQPAIFQTPNINVKRWCESGGNNVTLRGIEIRRYGLGTFEGDAAFRFPSGGSGWRLEDMVIREAAFGAIQFRGSGHHLFRVRMHDCGRYGWHGAQSSVLEKCEVYRIAHDDGTQLVPPWTANGDKGGSKMAGGSSGMQIIDLYCHDMVTKGIWWDGGRDGYVEGLVARDCDHAPVYIEVCWGGAEFAPPGKQVTWPDPAFIVENFDIVRSLGQDSNNPDTWPAPAGIVSSMTPGVHVQNGYIEDFSTGVGWTYAGSHNVFSQGFPAQNISAQWAQDNLNSKNNRYRTTEYVDPFTVWVAGATNDPYAPGPLWEQNDYSGISNPLFRWRNTMNVDLQDWLALGHS